MKIFLSGSISIKKIPIKAIEKIDSIIKHNYTILIGDAKGVDLNIQKYLQKKYYQNVTIYFAGENIRNNVGNWETKKIVANHNEKGRELYTLKDISMAQDADYALMIWDGESQGTLNNIKEMKRLEKKFYVVFDNFIVSNKNFDKLFSISVQEKAEQLNLF